MSPDVTGGGGRSQDEVGEPKSSGHERLRLSSSVPGRGLEDADGNPRLYEGAVITVFG